jgi:DNA-binding transcriptional ArsR family regulator
MDAAIQALAEPRRRAILQLVWESELSVGDIASQFEVTRPAISQHLRVLKDAGLVTERKQGTRRLYRARPEGLAEVCQYLEAFWTDRPERLKQAAGTEERKRTW